MKKTHHFDWDDNIYCMPTKIIIFNKQDKTKELPVSTECFAHIREKVGQDFEMGTKLEFGVVVGDHTGTGINLKDWEIIYANDESFREFRPHEDNFFLKHLKIAHNEGKLAPSFPDFVEACSTQAMANEMTIITARGQRPDEMMEGLAWLQSIGVIKYLPKLENLFPVSYSGFKGGSASASSPSDKKRQVILELLLKIESETPNALFGFSDDDRKTVELVRDFLKSHKTTLSVHLYFTGLNGIKEKVCLK
jgi:hypothetical protein